MLLISIDNTYSGAAQLKKTDAKAVKIFEKAKVTWPNVYDPDGWNGVRRNFNLDGYGLTLVGPDGVVLGIDIHPDKVEKLLAKLYPDATRKKPDAGAASQPAAPEKPADEENPKSDN